MFSQAMTPVKLEYFVVAAGVLHVAFRTAELSLWFPLIAGTILLLLRWLYVLETLSPKSSFKQFDDTVRSHGSDGLWCAILVPLALCLGYLQCQRNKYECSENEDSVAKILASIALLFSTLIWLNGDKSLTYFKVYSLIPPLLCAFFMHLWTSTGLVNSVVSGCILMKTFHCALSLLLRQAPKSFTIGEAIIVSHGISTFCFSSYLNFVNQVIQLKMSENETVVIGQCIQVAVLGSGLFAILLVKFPALKSSLWFYASASAIAAGLILPGLFCILWQNPIIWFVDFILKKSTRVVLMIHWAVSTVISILVVAWKQAEGISVKTVIRKYFHVLMIVAYLPGLFYDQNLLYFASGITSGIFIIIEVEHRSNSFIIFAKRLSTCETDWHFTSSSFRVLNVPPLGEMLNSAFSTFLDEKDQGPLILTHFYLLIGCSLPLWIVPEFNKDFHLAMLSGLLSIGIGDMMASIGGTYFGRHHWPGVSKTVEGTVFSIISQLFICQMLLLSGFVSIPIWKCLVGICLSSLLEAFTSQIDNLVLPLYLYILFIV